jgi:hypothetical protein
VDSYVRTTEIRTSKFTSSESSKRSPSPESLALDSPYFYTRTPSGVAPAYFVLIAKEAESDEKLSLASVP